MTNTERTFDNKQLTSFFAALKQHQERSEYCDITLIANDVSVECHKVVLSSSSSYLKQMFSSADRDTNIIDVSPLNYEVLNILIAYLYNSEYNLEDDNILELLDISAKWKLESLSNQCCEYMKQNITIDNACKWYEVTLESEQHETSDFINYFIRENFTILHNTNKLVRLSLNNFISIIANDEVNVENEDVVFDSAMRLIAANPESDDIAVVYRLIRYEHITSSYLLEEVSDHPLMRQYSHRHYIKEAVKYQCSKDTMQPSHSARFWGWHQMYLINKRAALCTYDQVERSWCEVNVKPPWFDGYTSMCTYKNETIVVGANNKDTGKHISMMKLSNTPELLSLPDLPVNLHSVGVLHTGRDIYVFGGRRHKINEDCRTVYYLRMGKEAWEELPPMIDGVTKPLVVLHKKLIYVLGGRGGWFSDRPTVQEYNLETSRWRLRKEMPHGYSRCNAGIIVYNGMIRVITPTQCMSYEPVQDIWTMQDYKLLGGTVQAAVCSNEILVCVKYVVKLSILKYDLNSNTWTTLMEEAPDSGYTEYFFAT